MVIIFVDLYPLSKLAVAFLTPLKVTVTVQSPWGGPHVFFNFFKENKCHGTVETIILLALKIIAHHAMVKIIWDDRSDFD